jgi:prephenate dehydrogenase
MFSTSMLSDSVVAIVGMGLMGGSLGMALCRSNACKEVRALVRGQETAEASMSLNAAHVAGQDPATILSGADLVVFATPVRSIERQISQFSDYFDPGTVVTDMGSVKRGISRIMRSLPQHVYAVGGHPMCGKETSGIQAADPDLFLNKVWVLTPVNDNDTRALSAISNLIEASGAKKVVMSPDDHDAVVAAISHLPYLMASTLVAVAEKSAHSQPAVWDLASSGFRDTSRVASGDLNMIMDILCSNKDNIIPVLETARNHMKKIIELLSSGQEDSLREVLSEVRQRRRNMFLPSISEEKLVCS